MKALVIALSLLLTIFSGCVESSGLGDVEGTQVEGCVMQTDDSRSGILRNLKEWIEFWSAHCVGNRPSVDFDKQLIAYDAWGVQPTGGYAVVFEEAEVQSDSLRVVFRRVAPGDSCFTTQMSTYPTGVAIIDVRRDAAFVEHLLETRDCPIAN